MQEDKISVVGPEVDPTESIYNCKYSTYPQYRHFNFGKYRFSVGDYVVVDKKSRPKISDNNRRLKIVKLLCIFKSDSGPHAAVAWFLQARQLPLLPDAPSLHSKDVVWDSRVSSDVIPLSAILGLCLVKIAAPDVCPETFLADQDNVYLLRFALQQKGGRAQLVPFIPEFVSSGPLKKSGRNCERSSSGSNRPEFVSSGPMKKGGRSYERSSSGSNRPEFVSSGPMKKGGRSYDQSSSIERGGAESSSAKRFCKETYFGFDSDEEEVDEELQRAIEDEGDQTSQPTEETEAPQDKEKRLLGEIVSLYEIINPELKSRPGRENIEPVDDVDDVDDVVKKLEEKFSQYFKVQQPHQGPVQDLSVDKDALFRVYVRHKFGPHPKLPGREPEIYVLKQKLQAAMGNDGERFMHVHGGSVQLKPLIDEALRQVRDDELFNRYRKFEVLTLGVSQLDLNFKKRDIEGKVKKNFFNQFTVAVVHRLDCLKERSLGNVRSLAHLVWLSTERSANLVLITSGQHKDLPGALRERIMSDTPMIKFFVSQMLK